MKWASGYTLTVRAEYPNEPGMLGRLASAIGAAGANVGAVDIVEVKRTTIIRDVTIQVRDDVQAETAVSGLKALPGVHVRSVSDTVLLSAEP